MNGLRPAVILDRDGVLNVDTGYANQPAEIQWIPGALEAVQRCHDSGYLVIVITNQSGVGRGFYDEPTVHRLHNWMANESREQGGEIAAFLYCPHSPDDDCACRKPMPGLFLRAIDEWNIDTSRSFSIGDKQRDIDASTAAGIPGYLFDGQNLAEFVSPLLERQRMGNAPQS